MGKALDLDDLAAQSANAMAELTELRRDAQRFRTLSLLLQKAYDGDTFESEPLDVYCRMQSGWRDERQVQAELRWKDVRDESLDLGAALDAVKDQGMTAQGDHS